MKCPYCEREMRKGYFHDGDQPIQWIPEGQKPSIWKTGVAEGAVSLGQGSYWRTWSATAFYCRSCKIIIAPVPQPE